MKGRNHLGDLGVDGRAILERMLQEQSVKEWTGFNWLRTGSNGGLL